MPQYVTGKIVENTLFSFPWRMILSGSSESGKTYFANMILRRQDLFKEQVKSVLYCYPCYMDIAPVSWHEDLNIPVSYKVGLPNKRELINLPSHSCVVLDDLYDEAIKNEDIDHLFRVISGKKKISVMLMTQNNFTQGRYGRDIRNSCNFSVLFRNCCDANINKRVAAMSGLRQAYDAAASNQSDVMYPYIFIDQSQKGQVSGYRLYSNIFDRFQVVWSVAGMKGYVIGEADFLATFSPSEKSGEFTAIKHDNTEFIEKKCSSFQPVEPEEIAFSTDTSSTDDDCPEEPTNKTDEKELTIQPETNDTALENRCHAEESAGYIEPDTNCGTGRKETKRRRLRNRHRKRFRTSVY